MTACHNHKVFFSKPFGDHKIKHVIYSVKVKIKYKESMCSREKKLLSHKEKAGDDRNEQPAGNEDRQKIRDTMPLLSPRQIELH